MAGLEEAAGEAGAAEEAAADDAGAAGAELAGPELAGAGTAGAELAAAEVWTGAAGLLEGLLASEVQLYCGLDTYNVPSGAGHNGRGDDWLGHGARAVGDGQGSGLGWN